MAKTYPRNNIIGQPEFEKPVDEIALEVPPGGALVVKSALEYITDQQRAYYRGVAVKTVAQETGYSEVEADGILKAACGGNELLKHEKVYLCNMPNGKPIIVDRLTIKGVGKINMSLFIDAVLAESVTQGWGVQPPDATLRSK